MPAHRREPRRGKPGAASRDRGARGPDPRPPEQGGEGAGGPAVATLSDLAPDPVAPGAPRDPPVASARRSMRLLAEARMRQILQALATGPTRPRDLRERLLAPSEATLHAHLRELGEIGAVARRKGRAPGAVHYELTPAGRDLHGVLDVAAAWLERRPGGPLAIEGEEASKALTALADGWGSAIIQHLACRPRSLSDLERLIAGPTHYAFKGRLHKLADHGLAVPLEGGGRRHPFELTEWGRRGVGPLAAAARWERTHLPREAAPVSVADAVAASLITLPLVRLPGDAAGVCELTFHADAGGDAKPGLVHAELEGGRVASCAAAPGPSADAWARGPIEAWFTAVLDDRPAALQLGGERELATALVRELHRCLYGAG